MPSMSIQGPLEGDDVLAQGLGCWVVAAGGSREMNTMCFPWPDTIKSFESDNYFPLFSLYAG